MIKESDVEDTPDRILLYGAPGVGKTWSVLKFVADFLPRSNLWVIDPDAGMKHLIKKQFMSFKKSGRLHYFLTRNFKQIKEASVEILIKARPRDIILFEQLGQFWDMAQSSFVSSVFHRDLGDYFVELRKNMVASKRDEQARLDGWKDWTIIKKMHNDDLMDVFTRAPPCTFIATTSVGELPPEMVVKKFADKELRALYKTVGLKPDGEKHTGYRFDAILLLARRGDEFSYVPVKVRGEEKLYPDSRIPRGKTVLQILWEKHAIGRRPDKLKRRI